MALDCPPFIERITWAIDVVFSDILLEGGAVPQFATAKYLDYGVQTDNRCGPMLCQRVRRISNQRPYS